MKPVSAFELSNRAIALIAVDVLAVYEMRHRSFGAALHCRREEGISRMFVQVPVHRQNLHDPRGRANIHHFEESNQFAVEEGANELAAIQITGVLLPDGLQILSIMPETASLSDGRFVVYGFDAVDQLIAEIDRCDGDSPFLRFSHVLA